MNDTKDEWLQLACARELLDRAWGKPREVLTVDGEVTVSAVYKSLEEMKQGLIEAGLPIDHLEAPRLLIEHEPANSYKGNGAG
jgi:hypothetical protein